MGMRGDLDVPHKLAVLAEHCEREGRDPSEIAVTVLVGCVVAPSEAELDADLRSMAEAKGWADGVIDMVKQLLIVGDADTVAERLAEIASSGVDGLTCNLPVNGHVPGRVALLGEVADRALAAAGR
jgi:alkanesulfonate monooxygenase SsuD/methylene tetrahydromethanopterin reductase-like flavin-dependent oxidoreductase (luciferase family)